MSVFLNRQLVHLKTNFYGEVTQPKTWRTAFPIDTSTPETADVAKLKHRKSSGSSRKNARFANEVPTVNVSLSATPVQLIKFTTSYGINKDDLKKAESLGHDLEADGAQGARDILEQDMNDLVYQGDSDAGITGLFDKVTQIQVAPNGAGDRNWSLLTGQEIVDQVAAGIAGIPDPFETTHIAASKASISTAKSKLVGTSGISAYQKIINEYGLTWVQVPECSTGGLGGTKCFVLYAWNPAYIYIELPMDVKQLDDMEESPMDYRVFVESKIGGLVVPQPASLYIGYDI